MENDIKTIVIDFIRTLQDRNSAEEMLDFYHPDIEQIEFPQHTNKIYNCTKFARVKKIASEKGKTVLQKENYEVIKSLLI
jgi:hypothetical protein